MVLAGGSLHSAIASPTYVYQQTIAIPGATAAHPFTGYDLSVFDPTTQLYYLTDRSNNGIDVFSSATNMFVERIGAGLFAGSQGGNNDIAGPNGISLSNFGTGKLLIVGNGPSNLITFNLDATGMIAGAPRTTSTAVAGTPVPQNRVDGVAFAPTTNVILAANNASNPGFLTLVNNATGAVIRTILLNGTGGYPDVGGNGVEATIFNTSRGTFFVAVPFLNAAGTGAGGVIELDATTGNLLHTYDFNAMGLSGVCSPTGLVQGGGASMFAACSDPLAGHSVILDPAGAGSLRSVNGISGGDQTAYDPTNNTFFEASRFQVGGPVLGVVDAQTLALQLLAIGPNDHSVAVDPITNEVFVATAATTAFADCANGCIGVFAVRQVPEPETAPLIGIAVAGLALARRFRRS
ncbi:MAG: PEP-CTERM sorting domain-containing protein [Burkholderiaceae bacterium]